MSDEEKKKKDMKRSQKQDIKGLNQKRKDKSKTKDAERIYKGQM